MLRNANVVLCTVHIENVHTGWMIFRPGLSFGALSALSALSDTLFLPQHVEVTAILTIYRMCAAHTRAPYSQYTSTSSLWIGSIL